MNNIKIYVNTLRLFCMNVDFYIQQKTKLLNDFDKAMKRSKKALIPYFGEEESDKIIRESHKEYCELIPQLPYIGGKENFNTDNLIKSAWYLAIFRSLEKRGKIPKEIWEISYKMTEAYLDSYPQFILRIIGLWEFTRFNKNKLRKQAEKSQKREYPDDWVFNYVEDEGKEFDFGLDYTECGIGKFFHKQKADKYTHFLCKVDFSLSKRYGTGLLRTKTIAEGHEYCDFRFKKGREK